MLAILDARPCFFFSLGVWEGPAVWSRCAWKRVAVSSAETLEITGPACSEQDTARAWAHEQPARLPGPSAGSSHTAHTSLLESLRSAN